MEPIGCGDGSKPILSSSMLDTAMGERARSISDISPEDLAVLREFNSVNNVEAPTLPTPDQMPPDSILDFTGDVDGGGIKNSMFTDYVNKPPLSLVPQALTYAAGRALGFGANKYAANNWRRGMVWSQPASGLLRHITAWLEGEDTDDESGLNHLDHAAACLAFLTHMVSDERYKKLDDRP